MPVYEKREEEIPARYYNIWRRAKLHLKEPIHIPLPGLKGLLLILEDEHWVCINQQQNDVPVILWFEFEAKGRDTLHEPVKCRVNHYHFAASQVAQRVLDLMEKSLQQMLHDEGDT
jgi:hypothetical protein